MSWSAPRTWATGDVIRASTMNTELRDNLLALGGHGHTTGAAGDGVIWTAIDWAK